MTTRVPALPDDHDSNILGSLELDLPSKRLTVSASVEMVTHGTVTQPQLTLYVQVGEREWEQIQFLREHK